MTILQFSLHCFGSTIKRLIIDIFVVYDEAITIYKNQENFIQTKYAIIFNEVSMPSPCFKNVTENTFV